MTEQKKSDPIPVICPKCGNAVYQPNFTAYSCPYCSIEIDKEEQNIVKEKPMGVGRSIAFLVSFGMLAVSAGYFALRLLGVL